MNFVRPWLAIGSLRDSCDPWLLSENGIGAILQLSEEVEHPNVATMYLPVDDGEPLPEAMLASGLRFVHEQHGAGKAILIGCGLGISRSVSFAVAALKESENISLLDAVEEIMACRPEARPHMVLWESLCSHYGEEAPYLDVLRLRRSKVER